jgi:hypothetical protein
MTKVSKVSKMLLALSLVVPAMAVAAPPAPAGGKPISRAEFEQRMMAHFDKIDTDHNGILSVAERQKAKAGHHGCGAAPAAHKA